VNHVRRQRAVGSIFTFLLLAPPAAALQVPIRVEQVLPSGVASRTTTADVVSVGVPFAPEDGLRDVTGLGMSGTAAAQFRVLQRDPNTDSVTWVLATFRTGAGPYVLTTGSGAFGGTALAQDLGARIQVSTGTARFEIRKSGFNLLDRVVVGTEEFVAPHTGGGVVMTSAGTRFESGLDTASDVVIEDNGPVAAVVRARGVLRSASGATLLEYTVRLHFGRDNARCRMAVTLRNASIAALRAPTFDAAWCEEPLRWAGNRTLGFGTGTGVLGGTVIPASTAWLFQGDNDFLRSPRTADILTALTPAAGLEAVIDGAAQRTLGTRSDVMQGWMQLHDATHGVFAGLRDGATLFPSGFHLQGDAVAVEFFSRHNPRQGLVFSWGAHETRELLWDFAGTGSADAFRAQLQYPLTGRCDYERYRTTGALCGERRLVTTGEETQFFAALGKTWQPLRYTEAQMKFDRHYSFGTTGGPNQFDQDECHLIDWLRTGYGDRFQIGRFGALFKADQAVLHSDDFDYASHQLAVSDIDVVQPPSFLGKGAGNLFEDEHPHWPSMILYYHLTGDEHVREAIEDYGEWRQYRAGNPTYGALWGGALGHMRLWSRCFRDVALLWEFTGQQRYLDHTRRMAGFLTQTLENGTSIGRNLQRGYFYFGDATDLTRIIHLFFLIEMNGIGTQEAMRVLPADDPLKEELRDYMSGLAWFTLQEAQISPAATGYPYDYLSAVPNPVLGTRGDQTGILLAHGYETSGDPEFVDRARSFAWRVPEYQHALRASELSEQLRIWRWLHRNECGAELLDPAVARNADGSYTLQWRAPAGAREYIVKYGRKPLVENLGFDARTRTFRNDPALAMNFWAATNVQGEPSPGAEGTLESYRTPVLGPGPWSFRVKVLARQPLTGIQSTLQPVTPHVPAGPHSGGPAPRVRKPGSYVIDRASSGIEWDDLPAGAHVVFFDVAGREVHSTWADAAGQLRWDPANAPAHRIPSGVLFYRIDAAGAPAEHGRLVLLR